MDLSPPHQQLLSWLSELPKPHRETLVRRYIFMTSSDSADFVLSGDEAWKHFCKHLLEPEFPLRRLARLLMVRAIMTFLLEQSSSVSLLTPLSDDPVDNVPSLEKAHFLRAGQQLRELTANGLSDTALQEWFGTLD